MAKELGTKELAAELGTDARTLRKFLRQGVKENGGTVGVDTPGSGGRYEFERAEVEGYKHLFAAWLGDDVEEVDEVDDGVDDELGELIAE